MQADKIAKLLPGIFQRTLGAQPGVLDAILAVMEAQHAHTEEVLRQLDVYFDPDRADKKYIPYLSGWVDLDRFLDDSGDFPAGIPRLRDLILNSAELARLRGTRHGLIRFLEVATGLQGFNIYDSSEKPFHINVVCPPFGDRFEHKGDYLAFVKKIVDTERPAYVTYSLTVAEINQIRFKAAEEPNQPK